MAEGGGDRAPGLVGTAPPRWDVTTLYPGPTSAKFAAAFDAVEAEVTALRRLFDTRGVGRLPGSPAAADPVTVALFEETTHRLDAVGDRAWELFAYLSCLVAADAADGAARARLAESEVQRGALRALGARYEAWVGSLDLEALLARSPVAREYAFALRERAAAARHRMSDAEEALASALSASGGAAWARLRRDITSRLIVRVRFPGSSTQQMPQSATAPLFLGADGAVRRAARAALQESWQQVEVPLAAALNGVKGELITLSTRRGWRDSLEPSLFANGTDRPTLEALHAAVREALPVFRRFLRAKARLLGKAQLAGWDLWASVVPAGHVARRAWDFDEAAAFIVAQFATYSHDLADLAVRAFRDRWVDAEPRTGKDPGGFSMPVGSGESRILVSYVPSFHCLRVLAHELGHAYHNLQLWRRPARLRGSPLPLAETASAFCETLVTSAALEGASGADRAAMLNEDLQWAGDRIAGMYGRFLLE